MEFADFLEIIKVDLTLVVLLGIHPERANELEPLATKTSIEFHHKLKCFILNHLLMYLAVDCVVLTDLPTLSIFATLYSKLSFLVLSPV